ncbi:NapC/NirT family cytochrome c [Mesobacillus zeae]|uniref:Cytochrome C n=1 Tax=Mesobacillus zeae TaxID=1917180 RepID=A0A398BAG4_9BACI|nr:NapC/NirT family cytochrome c [Mesobacillus zeae]RID84880.1 cytochrome C [Mesobacillus zeae]
MDEHIEDKPTPPPSRFRKVFQKNWSKIAALTLIFTAILFGVGYIGLEGSSSSKFCSSCHEMKPEYYTWKASSHSEADCVSCHVDPGLENLAKAKADGAKEAVKSITSTYTAPIVMPKEIPDSACETCHNMNNRNTTPSGDLIIPHDRHKNKDIKCTQCHSGVAHGKIAERKVTFKTDYSKWDESLGNAMMSDRKYIKPEMKTCMECHSARKVSTACNTCHTTGMYPASHKKEDFKLASHGMDAKTQLKECNDCHEYMSTEEIKLFDDMPAHDKYLQAGRITDKQVSVKDYAKVNTFCEKCHMQPPPSHQKGFTAKHGAIADENPDKCLACHDYQNNGKTKNKIVTCNSCHPSNHSDSNWRVTHPVKIPNGGRPSTYCYSCHSKKNCTSCHQE